MAEDIPLLEDSWTQGYGTALFYDEWIRKKLPDRDGASMDIWIVDEKNRDAVKEYKGSEPESHLQELTPETRHFLGFNDGFLSTHLALPVGNASDGTTPLVLNSLFDPLWAKFAFDKHGMIQIGSLEALSSTIPKSYYIFRAWQRNRIKHNQVVTGLKRYVIANVKDAKMREILSHEYKRLEATEDNGMVTALPNTVDLNHQAAFYTLLGSPYVLDVLRFLGEHSIALRQRNITEIRIQRGDRAGGTGEHWDIILEIGQSQRLRQPKLPPECQRLLEEAKEKYRRHVNANSGIQPNPPDGNNMNPFHEPQRTEPWAEATGPWPGMGVLHLDTTRR
ncbi:hypothetical protein FQN50_003048 [Emmonsiellopsis sp. PD_5]|nr:hypothetical protein FQN50_003048 [Emmonsiellopsis sp. PD_5]